MNSYLLESPDYLTIQKEIDKIIKENGFLEAEVSYYDMDEVLLENALEDLDTYSFLTSKKVIVIKNIEAVLEKINDDVEHLLKYIDEPNPDHLLIMCSKKLDDRRKVTKDLKKKCQFSKVTIDVNTFIKSTLKDYKLETGMVSLLIEFTAGDVTALQNECDKLKLYKFQEKEITKADIQALCVKKESNIENLTFDLINAVVARNKKQAFKLYEILKVNHVEPISLIGLFNSQMRLLYQVKILKGRLLRKEEIAKELAVHPFRVTKALERVNSYSVEEIHDFIKRLATLDLNIKKGQMDPVVAFEMFLINI